jgi:ankyrin repeat protein
VRSSQSALHKLKQKFARQYAVSSNEGPEYRPVYYCVLDDNIDAVKLLLDAGVSPNSQNKFGYTMLYIATSCCAFGVISLLLEQGADPSLPSIEEEAPMDTLKK